ncbi:hypothetical protein VAE122_2910231 [Vibrio aestuarianus]|nr:hypothetical protein VAE122_2910231 [Vibrio aestuarianus]
MISRFPGGDKTDSSFEHFFFAFEVGYKYTTKKLNYNYFGDLNHIFFFY